MKRHSQPWAQDCEDAAPQWDAHVLWEPLGGTVAQLGGFGEGFRKEGIVRLEKGWGGVRVGVSHLPVTCIQYLWAALCACSLSLAPSKALWLVPNK